MGRVKHGVEERQEETIGAAAVCWRVALVRGGWAALGFEVGIRHCITASRNASSFYYLSMIQFLINIYDRIGSEYQTTIPNVLSY